MWGGQKACIISELNPLRNNWTFHKEALKSQIRLTQRITRQYESGANWSDLKMTHWIWVPLDLRDKNEHQLSWPDLHSSHTQALATTREFPKRIQNLRSEGSSAHLQSKKFMPKGLTMNRWGQTWNEFKIPHISLHKFLHRGKISSSCR